MLFSFETSSVPFTFNSATASSLTCAHQRNIPDSPVMAILGKFEATISIGGNICKEYIPNGEEMHDAPNEATIYIEAVSGATFSINYGVRRNYNFKCDYLTFKLLVDGQVAPYSPVVESKSYRKREGWSGSRDGLSRKLASGWHVFKLKFADIETSQPVASISR